LETVAKRLYEGMFLIDSAQATADWEGTLSVINTILQRADAEVVSMRKWQERKLAYDIDHKSRGTYILCYFKVDGRRISGIEKDVLLSEKVMRALILTTEKRPAAMIERDIAGEPIAKPPELSDAPEGSREPRTFKGPRGRADDPSGDGPTRKLADDDDDTDKTAG
jgi:small subunit ribosomal protein S6